MAKFTWHCPGCGRQLGSDNPPAADPAHQNRLCAECAEKGGQLDALKPRK